MPGERWSWIRVGVASAAVDVSDGLMQDLGHVAAGSGVGDVAGLAGVPDAAVVPVFSRGFARVPAGAELAAVSRIT